MALGELTKQIAQQALLSATTKEPAAHAPAAPVVPAAENVGAVFLGQINAMQKAVKEDEELVVIFNNGTENIRVMEIFLPSPRVVVMTGLDGYRNLTRVISAADSLQLITRVAKVQAGSKPVRVSLVTPKPKDSNA